MIFDIWSVLKTIGLAFGAAILATAFVGSYIYLAYYFFTTSPC